LSVLGPRHIQQQAGLIPHDEAEDIQECINNGNINANINNNNNNTANANYINDVAVAVNVNNNNNIDVNVNNNNNDDGFDVIACSDNVINMCYNTTDMNNININNDDMDVDSDTINININNDNVNIDNDNDNVNIDNDNDNININNVDINNAGINNIGINNIGINNININDVTINNVNINNEVTLDILRDQIVAKRTFMSYMGDIFRFLKWIEEHENQWLTAYGRSGLASLSVRCEGEQLRSYRTRKTLELKKILRNAYEHPILHIDAITPQKYMEYIMSIKGKGNTRFLSNSAYNNRRSSLFHLYRMHNRIGYNDEFSTELTNLFRGFYRFIAQNRNNENIVNIEQDDNQDNKEGKDPMSVDLYTSLCGWLLSYGTTDGVFAYCYLVLTWNLACRARNTGTIRFGEVNWSTSFDSFTISFAHSKTDQLGEDSKHLRHIYPNPHNPLVCPVLALAMYFSCCFSTVQHTDSFLFPGNEQPVRFGNVLNKVLKQHEAEVKLLGYLLCNIGTHSIRKGAVSYLSSLPGGPPPAAICIRAGWTMGRVRDIYMRYVTTGDQFCGRCLALLPILRFEFGCSPPHFVDDADAERVEDLRKAQFPIIGEIPTFSRLTTMCLASLLYHRDYLHSSLDRNHVVLGSSQCFRSGELLTHLNARKEWLAVTYPWNDSKNRAFSGIPPHVALMQNVAEIKNNQAQQVTEFVGKMREVLEQMGVDGGRMSENNLRNILNSFEESFLSKVRLVGGELGGQDGQQVPVECNRIETGRVYMSHFYDGTFKRVPKDYRFPRCGVADLWRQWYIGDGVRNIPPLRLLSLGDLKHIDKFPIEEEEKHGRKGLFKASRRPARKILSDIKFLMTFVRNKVIERGALQETEISIRSVNTMFRAVADCFDNGNRATQKLWNTAVHDIRFKKII
jgi:hypothetical protein